MQQNFNPEKFRPKKQGKADFFSWQLYKWMKKNPYFCRIYKGVWNSATGYNPSKPVLYIGLMDDDCFMGNILRRICCYGAKLESYAFCSKAHHLEEWEDITDSFFEEYRLRGVCTIHGDMAHKWTYNAEEDARKCDHCGAMQRKNIEIVRRDNWVAVPY